MNNKRQVINNKRTNEKRKRMQITKAGNSALRPKLKYAGNISRC